MNDLRDSNIELTEEKWQAILDNDSSYNEHFFYAVKSTGIFCRPSCKSRPPKKENVLIFRDARQALSANFRPCKRCKPTGERLPDEVWIIQITEYIDSNFQEKLTLQTLADVCHGSPYHLQRTFKRVRGISPNEYIEHTRINKAIELLIHTNTPIATIGLAVGMKNTAYFVTLFKKKIGFTPNEYRILHNDGGL